MRGGIVATGVLLLLTSSLLAPGVAAEQARGAGRLVLGYYVPYDSTSWASLQAHAGQLDIVAAQWVSVDGCGNLGANDDQTLKDFARRRGVKVVPSLLTLSGWLNHQLLTDEDARANLISNIVEYTVTQGYDGFDLDLEGVQADDRGALSGLVTDVADALHQIGKILTIAIPAKDRDVTTGWAGPYDYAALGAAADLVTVMAYEYRGPFSGPGSVAPIDWVTRVADFSSSQIPHGKLLLGLAFYGYDWNLTSGGARSLGYPRAAALADRYQADAQFDDGQRSITFTYTSVVGEPGAAEATLFPFKHDIVSRALPPCDVVPPSAPPVAPPRRPAPPPGTAEDHEVWLEDSTSAAARLEVAARFGLRGVATWRLGLEDPGVWPLFGTWRGVDTPASTHPRHLL